MLVATHDGSFHADEVFAVATLTLIYDGLEVVRTRDREALAAADIRVDVGFRDDPETGDFDHHQRGFERARANGVGYASFGLVWRRYGNEICDGIPAVAAAVDATVVQTVDSPDTGRELVKPLADDVQPMMVGAVIAGLNGRWDEQLTPDQERERFDRAVELARGILGREIAAASAGWRAVSLVREAIAGAADPRVLELQTNAPWKRTVVPEAPEALYVIYPKRQGFGLEAVPREPGSFAVRRKLPGAWAGLEDDELAAATGVPDALFCHTRGFLVVAGSRDGIKRLAELALRDDPR